MNEFTHIDDKGNAVMVDVGGKAVTHRVAVATGRITMSRTCYDAVKAGAMKKGDVLGVARIGGIMGAKQTSSLIPLCHILNLTKCGVEFIFHDEDCALEGICTVQCEGRTGVEMEALTGVSLALLTVYDMCKAVDKAMVISAVHLVEKIGGKSGHFMFPKDGDGI
ncbi:MAG: cyclic pyranopterin monophosphate synthase MoaC [Megasphaera sp.]|jgi:cyclic pyranopterin phosphate synthase|nr:cyclic pyranopterin monophosphate synthase MoaC [Megasphaera sp.]MCH4187343.1 cyclic pyranopterin monophosphate synthase MoaC [Megasphaera sp.]MCH4217525.1 cyclic pyranopterin monophosphate synthase MoaC [Megasphaera sp.]